MLQTRLHYKVISICWLCKIKLEVPDLYLDTKEPGLKFMAQEVPKTKPWSFQILPACLDAWIIYLWLCAMWVHVPLTPEKYIFSDSFHCCVDVLVQITLKCSQHTSNRVLFVFCGFNWCRLWCACRCAQLWRGVRSGTLSFFFSWKIIKQLHLASWKMSNTLLFIIQYVFYTMWSGSWDKCMCLSLGHLFLIIISLCLYPLSVHVPVLTPVISIWSGMQHKYMLSFKSVKMRE